MDPLAVSDYGAEQGLPLTGTGTVLQRVHLTKSWRELRPSLVTLCSHKSGRCTVELYHASHLWYPPFYTSPMASSGSPTLNRQPYEGRLPLTSW